MNNQVALVIYHKVDYDGIFSSCIARDYYEKQGYQVELLGYNYGDEEVPKISELIEKYDFITLVDISFPPESMLELKEASKYVEVTWVDHHITAIQDSIIHGYSELSGIRKNGEAAVELCWKFFFGTPLPNLIHYLGRYDVWDKTKGNWESELLPLQYSLRAEYGVSHKNIWEEGVYNRLVYGDNREKDLSEIIGKGEFLLKYLNKTWASSAKNCSFPVTIGEGYKGVAIISTDLGSNTLKSVTTEDDISVVVSVRGNGIFKISMYSEKEIFNLGEYMKENYSGGGHATAAGGELGLEEFLNLIINHKI